MNSYRGFNDFPFVKESVSLSRMNTYRVGGSAEFFAEPPDAIALGEVLRRAADDNIPVRFLGHGTNLLVSDAGVKGLIIRLPKSGFGLLNCDSTDYPVRGDTLRLNVFAGHSLPRLVKWSVAQGLRGMECLQGVPGTVGAALRMNAGGKYGEICTSVRRVRGFDFTGKPFDFTTDQCGFVYRSSALSGRIVTDCELELCRGDAADGKMIMDRILKEKCATQPVDARSAGCVFKNPKTPGVPPAGKLIDDLGMKGMRIGGASVSTLHANFLICEGAARAEDIAELIRLIRERVFFERGIALQMEVEAWGFTEDELQPACCIEAA